MNSEESGKRILNPVSFDEFEPPSYEEWKEAAVTALKGAPFDKKMYTKTYEGITLEPIYTLNDAKLDGPQTQPPGCAPYVRGIDAAGYMAQPWKISQYVNAVLPEDANRILKEELDRGNETVHLSLNPSTLGCRNELDPADRMGVHLATLRDLNTALDGVDLREHPVQLYCGPSAVPMLGMLLARAREKGEAEQLSRYSGYIGADPLGFLAQNGSLPCPLDFLYDEMALVIQWSKENLPDCKTILIRSDCYHNGGANDVQEVAYCISTAIQYINAMQLRGLEIGEIAQQIAFSFSLGANFFMEIAKLRAVRKIWAEVIASYGGDEEAQKICVLARTSAFTTTALDPYVNVLRASTQTFSGVVGGIQGLSVTPFDEAVRESNVQSRRIARNIQLMFQNEFNMLQPVDPAGGSWYVESLTEQLGQAIWAQVQQTEGDGGILEQLKSGAVQESVEKILRERYQKLATRADRAVGCNMYANMLETPLEKNERSPEELVELRAQALDEYFADTDTLPCLTWLQKIPACISGEPDDFMSAVTEAFLGGATLQQVREALNDGFDGEDTVTPIKQARWTEPFETLRRKTEQYEQETGKTVNIFLANMGPVTQHKARADFITGFMEVGHFKVLGNNGFPTVEEAAQAAIDAPAQVIVICSSDPTYPELVPPLAHLIKQGKPQATVYLAGAPAPEYKDAYLEAGVDDFIHVKSNCLAMLTAIQQKEGIN
ncbi:MAG: methylmalonyl-CoA mutase family protein [Oscillospiraceae bacterium]